MAYKIQAVKKGRKLAEVQFRDVNKTPICPKGFKFQEFKQGKLFFKRTK